MNRTILRIAGLLLLAPAGVAARQEPHGRVVPDPSTYRVYTAEGEPATLEELVAATGGIDVVFLGESHTDRVGHQLQLEILHAIIERERGAGAQRGDSTPGPVGRDLILSMEMFERDIQYVIDEYLAGLIPEDQFRRSTRPWTHYQEDYHALVETARGAGLRILGANAPRRYVNLVSREGPGALGALSATALRSLPPLPWQPPSDAYRTELLEVMGEHGDTAVADTTPSDNELWAQSLWDATMAFSIAETLLHDPGVLVVHVVGSFHVRNGTGIPEQLERYRPGTRRLIVLVEPVADVATFDAALEGTGDFLIQTDESLAREVTLPSRDGT